MFLKNLLRISEYAPELRDRILETIVDRLIQIDVRAADGDEMMGAVRVGWVGESMGCPCFASKGSFY